MKADSEVTLENVRGECLELALEIDPGKARRVGSNSEKALNVLCAEAQADGVPCFELGRQCETCELAYRWYVTWVEGQRS